MSLAHMNCYFNYISDIAGKYKQDFQGLQDAKRMIKESNACSLTNTCSTHTQAASYAT